MTQGHFHQFLTPIELWQFFIFIFIFIFLKEFLLLNLQLLNPIDDFCIRMSCNRCVDENLIKSQKKYPDALMALWISAPSFIQFFGGLRPKKSVKGDF